MKLRLTASALLALLSTSSVFAANLTIPMSFEYLHWMARKLKLATSTTNLSWHCPKVSTRLPFVIMT